MTTTDGYRMSCGPQERARRCAPGASEGRGAKLFSRPGLAQPFERQICDKGIQGNPKVAHCQSGTCPRSPGAPLRTIKENPNDGGACPAAGGATAQARPPGLAFAALLGQEATRGPPFPQDSRTSRA